MSAKKGKASVRVAGQLSPAEKSARKASLARASNEACLRRALAAADEAGKKKARARARACARQIRVRTVERLLEYRAAISKAESQGRMLVHVDEERWSGSYYERKPTPTEQDLRRALIESESKQRAETILKKDGYRVMHDGTSHDTEWGAGSDPLPVAGVSYSWTVIAWGEDKK